MRKIASLCVPLMLVWAVGCKKSNLGEEANQQAAQEQKIVQTQQEQSQKLDEIRARIASLSSAAAAQKAQPDFEEDLAAAKRLNSQLSVQASKQQDKDAAPTLDRLIRSLATLVAGAPASRIQEQLERAMVHLTAGDLAGASGQVLGAAGAAYNPSAPALVPDVLTQLEDASVALSGGDAGKATTIVAAVIDKTSQDATASDLLAAQATAMAAKDSLRLKAWPILIAQSAYIADLLAAAGRRSQPQAQVTQEKAAAPTPQPETAPAPSGATQPPSAATGQPPAATGAPTAPTAPATSPAPGAPAAPTRTAQPQPKPR